MVFIIKGRHMCTSGSVIGSKAGTLSATDQKFAQVACEFLMGHLADRANSIKGCQRFHPLLLSNIQTSSGFGRAFLSRPLIIRVGRFALFPPVCILSTVSAFREQSFTWLQLHSPASSCSKTTQGSPHPTRKFRQP